MNRDIIICKIDCVLIGNVYISQMHEKQKNTFRFIIVKKAESPHYFAEQ